LTHGIGLLRLPPVDAIELELELLCGQSLRADAGGQEGRTCTGASAGNSMAESTNLWQLRRPRSATNGYVGPRL